MILKLFYDFEVMYPNKTDELVIGWNDFAENFIRILSPKKKDLSDK
jgi:hypothetical protein